MQKSFPGEKVVQVYEKLFTGQDITSGRAEFWAEFFLLRVNIKVLLQYFDKVPQRNMVDLKFHLSRLYEECLQKALNTAHWQRIANAIQTADSLMLGAFQSKTLVMPSEQKLELLIPKERLIRAKVEYLALCKSSFTEDWPPLLQELVINSLTLSCVLTNQLNENPLFEWLIDENLYVLLGTLISNSCLRRRFGVGACRLLALISQYRWKEINNPFLVKLAQVKDDILLNSISAIISFAISQSTRKYNEYVNASGGVFSSISSMLGGRRNDSQQNFSIHDGLLLCLYVITLHNPRFHSLFTCPHTHQHYLMELATSASLNKLTDLVDMDPASESYFPSTLPHDPRNLMADLIEFASVVMQDIRDSPERLNTCTLCFKIMSQATTNLSLCCFLHEYNTHFTIQLHRARLRHRKSTFSLLDRSSTNTISAVLLDLLVEFFCTHLMKSFPFEIHCHCLDICYHLLSHQKEHNIRLDYDWRQLWKSLIDLMKFVVKPNGPAVSTETFTTLLKIVGIFNFFVTFGDCFLLGPSAYDDLYYELIRMKDVVESLVKFADQHLSSLQDGWKYLAGILRDSISNLEAIVKHFNIKISDLVAGAVTLTEAQVFEIIQDNYDTLNLRVYENLHRHYERNVVDWERSDEVMLGNVIQSVRKNCLDTATAYQSRFAELAVIH